MRVRDRMTPNPVTVSVNTSVSEAIQILEDNRFRRLPVLDKEGVLVGIVTERELQGAMPSRATSLSAHELNYILMKTRVGEILPKRKLVTIDAGEPLEEAAVLMRNQKIGAIPVMSAGKLAGIITETNMFDAFIDIMGLRETGFRMEVEINGNPPGILGQIATIIGKNGGNISHVSVDVTKVDYSKLVLRFSPGADIGAIVKELEQIVAGVSYETI